MYKHNKYSENLKLAPALCNLYGHCNIVKLFARHKLFSWLNCDQNWGRHQAERPIAVTGSVSCAAVITGCSRFLISSRDLASRGKMSFYQMAFRHVPDCPSRHRPTAPCSHLECKQTLEHEIYFQAACLHPAPDSWPTGVSVGRWNVAQERKKYVKI